MNKKQLIVAILALAAELHREVITKDLDEPALKLLHEELVAEKSQAEQITAELFSKQEKAVLKFNAPYKRYANGDVAGFDTDVAIKILALKPSVADIYEEESDE